MEDIVINIRDIQHFLYCKHRWGLLNIGSVWAENYYVTKANLLHTRVHDFDSSYSLRGKQVFTAINIYNDELSIYGSTDCLELTKCTHGVVIPGFNGKYKLCLVEYKPTQPKDKSYNEEDLMQVFAQKQCIDYMFQCDCEASLYYSNTRKRVPLPLNEGHDVYMQMLIETLTEMRSYLQDGIIPGKKKNQKCNGCSLRNICMPAVKRHKKSIRDMIKENSLCASF